MSLAIIILSAICALLAIAMLFSKNAISAALSLLGVLICTAGIYGLLGEHLVATIQLVVYAGAIMVLFIFSIMLLNLNKDSDDRKGNQGVFYTSVLLGAGVFAALAYGLNQHFKSARPPVGFFSPENVAALGGNSKVMAHSLFTQFFVSFEVISLALLVAVVGAVVLAKRHFD